MAPPRTSTIPDNMPLTLPPIDPPAKKGAAAPVVYSVRLSDEVVNALLAADNPTIKFSSDTKGVLSVPQLRDIPFTARPIADAHTDGARAVCYSRRGSKLRTVGPIVADLAVEQRMSSTMSDMTKKRGIEATMAKSGREVKKLDTLPSDLPASKRPRVSKSTKRPRPAAQTTTRRPALVSQPAPIIPLSKPAPPPNSRSPSAPNAPPLRSAPPSAGHSPASPGHATRNPAAPRPPSRSGPTPPTGVAKRTTPTRPALGAMPRKPSPATALPAASLPRPGARRPASSSSRGPSPAGPPSGAVSSPRSPRLAGGLRSRPRERVADVRRVVVHALALRDCTMSALKARVRADDGSETYDMLLRVVQDVAEKRSGVLRLKGEAWAEVNDDFEGYSDGERSRVRNARAEAARAAGSGMGPTRRLVEPNMGGAHGAGIGAAANGGGLGAGADAAVKVREIGTHGMSDGQLDHRLEAYERDERGLKVGKVASDEDEAEVRRRFAKWYPVYQAMVGRLEDMRRVFSALEKSMGEAHGPRERDGVVKEIHATHGKYGSRHTRYSRMLPILHARLKEMHRALEEAAL